LRKEALILRRDKPVLLGMRGTIPKGYYAHDGEYAGASARHSEPDDGAFLRRWVQVETSTSCMGGIGGLNPVGISALWTTKQAQLASDLMVWHGP